jgi:hypothetical protein
MCHTMLSNQFAIFQKHNNNTPPSHQTDLLPLPLAME